jgi:DinB superfamily
MDSSLAHKELLDKFRSGPGKLERSIDGLTEEELEFRPAPGKWTIREIVIHLCDSEIVGSHRIRKIFAEDNGLLIGYDQDQWAKRLNYGKRNLSLAVDLFRLLRKSTAELFEDATESDWQRVGTHNERGPISVADLVQLYADHAENHVAQIRQIRLQLSQLR